jgi:hypothetical protein
MNAPTNRVIDPRFYEDFYRERTGEPPPCFEVFTARYDGSMLAGMAHVQQLQLTEAPDEGSPLAGHDIYTATFAVGHLVLKVYGRDPAGESNFVHHKSLRGHIARIWPPGIGSFTFPPGGSLNDQGFAVFMGDTLL